MQRKAPSSQKSASVRFSLQSDKDFSSVTHGTDMHDWLDWEEGGSSVKSMRRINLLWERLKNLPPNTRDKLLEYFQFKAARTIQAAWRGYYTRKMLKIKTEAAEIIQRAWKSFFAKRYYYRLLEFTVQQSIEAHYYRAAQIIQAFWRGYLVRKHIHDQYRLQRLQLGAAEDLLSCVAYRLHHLLRTHQIPGIYSIRNSSCLSKVEKLLTTASIKKLNYEICLKRAQNEPPIHEAKQQFYKSQYETRVPYPGADICDICKPQCKKCYKKYGELMYKILKIYEAKMNKEKAQEREYRAQNRARRSHKALTPRVTKKVSVQDFCTEIVKSMQRWNIISDYEYAIDPAVVKAPEKMENFLDEIQEILNTMESSCYCKVDTQAHGDSCSKVNCPPLPGLD
ncbi:uncharacterized protein LOC119689272 [Teleopsis dalmanni]|uniref:uncharacterized protein LOC119689272 n=1 Tax=Teleopsis dalmanni TaxID=139649 RepID=UPI0018CD039F|nr:uncharacterized protein LOC119689272 [Teleopsis dalmanni]